jgi:hypothetical protein
MDESHVSTQPQASTSRRRFLIRVGGGLAAAAVAPFVMTGPAEAAGRCEYYYCEWQGIYVSPSCVVYYWFSCYDLDTGFHCFDHFVPA